MPPMLRDRHSTGSARPMPRYPDGPMTDTQAESSRAQFTRYLTIILRLSYDNAEVTIDLRRTSNLQQKLTKSKAFHRYESLAKL